MNNMLLIAVVITLASADAVAQSTSSPAVTSAASADSAGVTLEDVIVTAERREERLQDVPIAVTALDATQLAAQGVHSPEDLTASIPALVYHEQVGSALPYLRGIGSDISQPNTDAEVPTYIDGVYLSDVASSNALLNGVERMEVLEGPQGTLFGRNSVAGVINIVTRTPTDESEGSLTTGYGNYNRFDASGYLSGKLVDNLDGGIYATAFQRDNYYHFLSLKNQLAGDLSTPNGTDGWNVRGKLAYNNGPVSVAGSVEHSETNTADSALRNIVPTALGITPFGAPYINKPFVEDGDGASFYRTRQTLAIVHGQIDLGWSNVISISSYRDSQVIQGSDLDGTSAPVIELSVPSRFSKSESQELQLQSPSGSKVKWIAGVYAYHENTGFSPEILSSGILFAALGPGTFSQENYGLVNSNSWAVFGQSTVPLFETLNLTLGVRYSRDYKTFHGSSEFAPIVDGSVDSAGAFGSTATPEIRADWGAFTPKVSLDYKLGDTLLYATYARGYKSGAFNPSSPATPGPVAPETLDDYEVGSKSEFLDHRLRLNTSVYYYTFNNLQVEAEAAGTSGSLATLQNAASAQAYGVEASLDAKLTSQLTVGFSENAENTKYSSFANFAGYNADGTVAEVVDATGNRLPRAPQLTTSTHARYDQPLPDGSKLSYLATWSYSDGFFWDAHNILRQPAYHLLDASVSYATSSHWDLSLWARNITDARVYSTQIPTGFGTVANDGAPRTYGFRATVHF